MRILLIGCGPTGLGFLHAMREFPAYDSQEKVEVVAIEEENVPGGLSASVEDEGFIWEYGPHIFHSHYKYFSDLMSGWDLKKKERNTKILFNESLIPYPFQMNIQSLPSSDAKEEMLRGLGNLKKIPSPVNMEEWARSLMGDGIYEHFYKPLNSKSWCTDPSRLGTMWVKERVPVPSTEKRKDWGPNSTFSVSKNGIVNVWKKEADLFPIIYGTSAVSVNISKNGKKNVLCFNRRGDLSDYSSYNDFDIIVNTSPLDIFVKTINCCPYEVKERANLLKRNGLYTVCLGIRGEVPEELHDISWIYFPERKYPWHRLTVFSNYSEMNAPPGNWSVIFETSIPNEMENSRSSLQANILSQCMSFIGGRYDVSISNVKIFYKSCNYPIPTVDRDESLAIIHNFLESNGIYSRGRFGGWKYEVGNMDHSFMQGIELYKRIFFEEEEKTYNHPEIVNSYV